MWYRLILVKRDRAANLANGIIGFDANETTSPYLSMKCACLSSSNDALTFGISKGTSAWLAPCIENNCASRALTRPLSVELSAMSASYSNPRFGGVDCANKEEITA